MRGSWPCRGCVQLVPVASGQPPAAHAGAPHSAWAQLSDAGAALLKASSRAPLAWSQVGAGLAHVELEVLDQVQATASRDQKSSPAAIGNRPPPKKCSCAQATHAWAPGRAAGPGRRAGPGPRPPATAGPGQAGLHLQGGRPSRRQGSQAVLLLAPRADPRLRDLAAAAGAASLPHQPQDRKVVGS